VRVLLVEDEALISMMMEDLLTELGCEVVASFGALQPALDWLEAQAIPPDGAVLDINLGGGEMVFPLASRLQALGVPFVFATGYGRPGDEGFAFVPLLQKPVDLVTLWPVIQSFGRAA
jgi:CheY-like chemotaxis protein